MFCICIPYKLTTEIIKLKYFVLKFLNDFTKNRKLHLVGREKFVERLGGSRSQKVWEPMV